MSIPPVRSLTLEFLKKKVDRENRTHLLLGIALLIASCFAWVFTAGILFALAALLEMGVRFVLEYSETTQMIVRWTIFAMLIVCVALIGFFRESEWFSSDAMDGYLFTGGRSTWRTLGGGRAFVWGEMLLFAPIAIKIGISHLRTRRKTDPELLEKACELFRELQKTTEDRWVKLPPLASTNRAADLLHDFQLIRLQRDHAGTMVKVSSDAKFR